SQQFRWAWSVLELKFRPPHISGRLSLASRVLNYFQGGRYLSDSAFVLAFFSMLVLLLVTNAASTIVPILEAIGLLYLALIFTNFYAQRFYLDWSSEAGVHWRAYLLRFVKWPYTLLALRNLLLKRRLRYTLTPKISGRGNKGTVMWPQIF